MSCHWNELELPQRAHNVIKVARLQSAFWHERFLGGYEFSYEKRCEIFLEVFEGVQGENVTTKPSETTIFVVQK